MRDAPTVTRPTVLLIDDDPLVRKVYTTSLELGGFEVVSRPNKQLALELIGSGFVPHVAVVDLHLENGRGLEIPRDLVKVPGRWPMVLFTGFYSPDLREEAFGISPRIQGYHDKARIAMTEQAAAERGHDTIATLCRDAIARSRVVNRFAQMDVADAMAKYRPKTLRDRIGEHVTKQLAARKSTRVLARVLAVSMVGIGAALTKWGNSRGGGGGWIEVGGAALTAMGGALGLWLIGKKGTSA
jgi:CheY-like chemotaxis protein